MAIGLISSLAIGMLGIVRSRSALTRATLDRMSALRSAKQGEVVRHLASVADHLRVFSESTTSIEATNQFVREFESLKKADISVDVVDQVRQYYRRTVWAAIKENGEISHSIDELIPKSNQALHLQYRYIVRNPHPPRDKAKLTDAADGAEYSEIHASYHPSFVETSRLLNYYDILIFHPETREVVYSVNKEIDLGTSFETGPFSNSNLASAVRSIDESTSRDTVIFVDFESYVPSLNRPAMFMVTPILDGDKLAGIMAIQFSTKSLNRIFIGGASNSFEGLGRTSEVFLVGRDGLMRTDSRFFIENSEAYANRLRTAGFDDVDISRMKRHGTTILTISRNTDTVRRIFEDGFGAMRTIDQVGRPALSSFAPLRIPGLNWGIVAQIEEQEALETVNSYMREAALLLFCVLLSSGIAAIIAGRAMTRPILKLTHAVRSFVNGNRDVRVKIETSDEVSELARAFNLMASEIQSKEDGLKRQAERNRVLLENCMPAVVMASLRGNPDEFHTPYHREATLTFVKVEGVDEIFEERGANEGKRLIQNLIDTFDKLAQQYGIEKLSSSGAGYLAGCGLTEPHFDHTRQVLEFVQNLENMITEFDMNHSTGLQLSIGVHRGFFRRGKFGRESFVNDLWTKTISLVTDFDVSPGKSSVRVSDEIRTRVERDSKFKFQKSEDVMQPVTWILKPVSRT